MYKFQIPLMRRHSKQKYMLKLMSPVSHVICYVKNMILPDTSVPPIFGIIISNNNTAITTHRVKSTFYNYGTKLI